MTTCFNSIDSRRQSDGVAVHWSVDGVLSVCVPVYLSLVHSGLSDLDLMPAFSSVILDYLSGCVCRWGHLCVLDCLSFS